MFEKRNRIIIVGAPRCSTTSLFRYLNDHPNIYGPQVKETCYFLDQGYFPDSYNQTQLLTNFHDNGYQGYSDLFEEATSEQVLMDATPDYMYQDTFLKILPELDPKPTIVMCVRQPSKRIYSMYKYAQSRLGILANDVSFSEYIDMVYSKHHSLKEHNVLNDAIEQSKYINHLDKIEKVIGKEQMVVFSFEDFIVEPVRFINMILDKSGIKDDFYENYDFKKFNESYEVKTQIIRKIYEKLPLPYSFRYGDSKVKDFFKNLNLKFNSSPNSQKSDGEQEIMAKLERKEFASCNERLSKEYQVGIASWK